MSVSGVSSTGLSKSVGPDLSVSPTVSTCTSSIPSPGRDTGTGPTKGVGTLEGDQIKSHFSSLSPVLWGPQLSVEGGAEDGGTFRVEGSDRDPNLSVSLTPGRG